MNRLAVLGGALGSGIVLGWAIAQWLLSEPQPPRVRPCPSASFHHAPRRP
jgi:hypothetical protein